MYVRNNLCPTYENTFMTHTDNIRIIKYDVGQLIKDHSDVTQNIRGSLTINLNDDYEGGEFRFLGDKLKLACQQEKLCFFLENHCGFMAPNLLLKVQDMQLTVF